MLVLFGFFLPLGLFEAELAVVHDLAHRGDSLGGDFHQVQIGLLCDLQGLSGAHNTQLLAVGADQADLFVTDLFIDLMILLLSANTETPP